MKRLTLLFLLATVARGKTTANVKIVDFHYQPAVLRVSLGTPVVWTNRDEAPHMVMAPDGLFNSGLIDSGEKFTYTFMKKGTYRYYCGMHPTMVGSVEVR